MSTLYTAFSDDTSFPGIRYLSDIEERERESDRYRRNYTWIASYY